MWRPCPVCGSEQPTAAAFCSVCGTALHGEERRAGSVDERQERRIVTVLFADLSGSTALGEQLDPEDVRELQGELFDLLNAEVERFGGTTEKFVGDAILAVFGIPQAHEDDPERAVRAALAARAGFGAFAERVRDRHGAAVGLRIGVNTGEVVSSREAAARGELMVSGDAVNVAARLQQNAKPGEILVGQRTYAATNRKGFYGPGSAIDAKGKSAAIAAWAALALDTPPAVRPVGLTAPLIGRDEELALLQAIASRVEREGVPQLVTLFGPAGVGKSRLLAELLERLGHAHALRGRCLPYGEGITYWPLAEAAKAEAQVLDTDPAEIALSKLREAVQPVVGDDSDGAVEAIAWTIGFALHGSSIASAEPQHAGARLADGWQRYIAGLGRRGLTIVVVEDIHWASAALLDLLEHLADTLADTRVVLFCTARSELLEQRPLWGAGKQNATALSLTPLSPDESARLVSSLLGTGQLPEALGRPLLSSAEGNPFYLEEMLQMLIEQGALEPRNGSWVTTGRLAQLRVPDSVHGVIAARLDLLEPGARDSLRRCAVVGRIFWPAAVGVDEEVIASLAKTGLVTARPASVMAGLREFAFKHALTRDVAYNSLTRPERRDLHRRVAEWTETVAPDRDVETAELAGYHYREAITYGEDDAAVAGRAFELLLAAGEAATRRAAFAAAREQLGHALPLAADDNQRASVLVALAEAGGNVGSWDEALAHLDTVDALPDVDARLRSAALGWRSRISWLSGRWEQALAAANDAVAALAGLPESIQLARALARRSQIAMLRNRPEADGYSLDAIAVAERVGDEFADVNARINLFTIRAARSGEAPDPDEVLELVERAAAAGAHEESYRAIVNFLWSAVGLLPVDRIVSLVAAGRAGRLPPPPSIRDYLEISIAAMLLVPAGRWAEADAILAGVDPQGLNATPRLLWLPTVGGLALRRGDTGAADELLRDVQGLALASGEPQRIVPMASAVLPWLLLADRRDEVRELTRELLTRLEGYWPAVLSADAIIRTLAAASETELLAATAESIRRSEGSARGVLRIALTIADALLALGRDEPGHAVTELTAAVAREEELGLAYDAACLKLDLARALEQAGDGAEAARVRENAMSLLTALGCVNPV